MPEEDRGSEGSSNEDSAGVTQLAGELVSETERFLGDVRRGGPIGWAYRRLPGHPTGTGFAIALVVGTGVVLGMIALLVLTVTGARTGSSPASFPYVVCSPHGSALRLSAAGLRFDTDCLATNANRPFTLIFENRDDGIQHMVAIYTPDAMDRNTAALFKGWLVTGPGVARYRVDSLRPGRYYFVCLVHPARMRGTLIVK